MNLTATLAAVRNYLGDTTVGSYTWTDDQLKLWINGAIDQYNIHFPKRYDYSIDAVAGTRLYNLPYNVHGIISVEYQPLGSSTSPKTFYKRHDRMLDTFNTTDEVYDWIKNDTSDGALAPPILTVNPVTANNADTYIVAYNGDHAQLTLAADVLSVPDRHLNLLYLYIRWQAVMELSTGVKRQGIISPGGTFSTIYQPYSEIDIKRNLDAYNKAVLDALAAESESAVTHWQMDKHGRVY